MNLIEKCGGQGPAEIIAALVLSNAAYADGYFPQLQKYFSIFHGQVYLFHEDECKFLPYTDLGKVALDYVWLEDLNAELKASSQKTALIAEIERFKVEALKMHIVQVLADSYKNTNLFDYTIDSDGTVIWYKAQARQLWNFWQAKTVPEGFALLPKIPSEKLIYEELEKIFPCSFCHDGPDSWKRTYIKVIEAAQQDVFQTQEPAND